MQLDTGYSKLDVTLETLICVNSLLVLNEVVMRSCGANVMM